MERFILYKSCRIYLRNSSSSTDSNWTLVKSGDVNVLSMKHRGRYFDEQNVLNRYDQDDIMIANKNIDEDLYSLTNIPGDQLVIRTFQELSKPHGLVIFNFKTPRTHVNQIYNGLQNNESRRFNYNDYTTEKKSSAGPRFKRSQEHLTLQSREKINFPSHVSHNNFGNKIRPDTRNHSLHMNQESKRYRDVDYEDIYEPDVTQHAYKDGQVYGGFQSYQSRSTDQNMPPEEEVSRQFGVLLDGLNLSDNHSLKSKPTYDKWELLKGKESVNEGRHTVAFYLNQIERHLDPQLRVKSPPKKLYKGLLPLENILTSLEVDLRSNPNATWLREFIDEPNGGHIVLLKLMKQLQEFPTSYISSDKTTNKIKKIDSNTNKETNEEHICLLCIKAIARNKYGFHQVLSAPRSLSTLVICLRLSNIKTKMAVLKIFSDASEHSGGFEKILQAFEDYKLFKQERFRFESLVHSIIFNGRLNNPSYQECVLHFFNALLSNAPSLNQRVFHQQELEQAGFSADKIEQALEGTRADAVREEIRIWRANYIDVSQTLDEFVHLRGRSTMLRNEVNTLQSRLEDIEREKNQVILEKRQLENKVNDYKMRTCELHDRIDIVKRKQAAEENSNSIDFANAIEEAVDEIFRSNTPISPQLSDPPKPPMRSSSMPATLVPPPPPLPSSTIPMPPPPPPPPGSLPGGRRDIDFKSSSAKLPMLHWQPIVNPSKDSIFMKLSPITLAEKLDFCEFEKMFEIKQAAPPKNSLKREAALQKLSAQLTVLDSNKARNVLIAKKRISLETPYLVKAIDTCDCVTLPFECTELLLKFTPTPEERSVLLKNSNEIDNMAEAEQFLFQLTKIERLEAKLNTMSFMGAFDELFRTVSPQIEAIITASVSTSTSNRFSRLIEVILAYGNYINGARKGFTAGFKLDSLTKLDEIKTNDKKISFLQYLVDIMRLRFPDIHTFYEDIEVQPALNLSLETLATDVQHLRKGLDVTKTERDNQPDNYTIHNFFNRAMIKVQQVTERYRKMEEHYQSVCLLFCENPKSTEPSTFFNTIYKFVERYKEATREIDERKQEDKAIEKAELLKSQYENSRRRMARIASDAVHKRRSLYDQNENRINNTKNRPLSEMFYGSIEFEEHYRKTDSVDFLNHQSSDGLQTFGEIDKRPKSPPLTYQNHSNLQTIRQESVLNLEETTSQSHPNL